MTESIEICIILAFVLLLYFLFAGEPDLFDALRELAIQRVKQ